MDAVVEFDRVEVRIGGRRVLEPLSLTTGPGQRWAVLGPNGSGKTTLLRLAGALRLPSRGMAVVLGARLGAVDLRALRERIAFVGHAVADAIPPGLAVREVVLTGKRSTLVPWLQRYDAGDLERAEELLRIFGCAHLDGQALAACSQGERQRVLIARALFSRPELLLLDEPAAGLDLPGREGLVRALEDAGDLVDVPSILVTHHLEELPTTITHAALLDRGRLAAAGPVAEVLTAERVGACFGMALSVGRTHGRWTVSWARPSGPTGPPGRT
ncbi:MAG TPA: ATP-binding cassette domain-containing protein [Actinomycetota bacterium]